jgi:hypothetical protein
LTSATPRDTNGLDLFLKRVLLVGNGGGMRHHILRLVGLGVAVTISCVAAKAETLPLSISIADLTEGMPTVLVNNNPPAANTCATTDEHAACNFLFLSGSLGLTVNDSMRRVIAVLKEPGSSEVSDEVRISFFFGTPNDSLILTFESDRPGFAFEDDLVNFAVDEAKAGNNLTNNFVSTINQVLPNGNMIKRGDPVALPNGLTVFVQSDIDVPEPTSISLMLLGIAVALISRARRRSA